MVWQPLYRGILFMFLEFQLAGDLYILYIFELVSTVSLQGFVLIGPTCRN